MNIYTERLTALRAEMKAAGVDAVIIPQADPHLGEYLASHWQVRRWLSGFSGSAGDLVVTADKAALWTDSRYFIQDAEQLEGSGVELMKDGLAETPSIGQWLSSQLPKRSTAGLDGMLFTLPRVKTLVDELFKNDIYLKTDFDVIDRLWTDRPALPDGKIFVHEEKYAGESASSKLAKISEEARECGADAVLMTALDEIAWTLNIRCNDVKHTPVATSYLYIRDGKGILFIDPAKLTHETTAYLASQGVVTEAYDAIKDFLRNVGHNELVLVDINSISVALYDILVNNRLVKSPTTAARLKSVKNPVQIAGVQAAMVRDGAALVRAFMELEKRLAEGVETTELDVADLLHKYRSQGENYFDESFGTIAGYGPHGAIVHYEASEESKSTLRREGLLLVDSGAQYLDGTTDITRTVCLGTPTADERRDFTLVMKGHIALASSVFLEGTRGAQLNVLAEQYLWKNGLSYLHGTGHGVGFFLSVHEGPHSIRLNWVDAPLLPGSITSDEPGLYREGVHGIRCENLVLCKECMTTEFGRFLGFEVLTLFPFDRNLFDTSIMSAEEIDWVNNYHATVRERLMPALATDAERQWLTERTAAI